MTIPRYTQTDTNTLAKNKDQTIQRTNSMIKLSLDAIRRNTQSFR
jgi:IS1 family transposase